MGDEARGQPDRAPPLVVTIVPERPGDAAAVHALTDAAFGNEDDESALIDRKGNIRAYFVNKRDWETPVAQTCLRAVIDE